MTAPRRPDREVGEAAGAPRPARRPLRLSRRRTASVRSTPRGVATPSVAGRSPGSATRAAGPRSFDERSTTSRRTRGSAVWELGGRLCVRPSALGRAHRRRPLLACQGRERRRRWRPRSYSVPRVCRTPTARAESCSAWSAAASADEVTSQAARGRGRPVTSTLPRRRTVAELDPHPRTHRRRRRTPGAARPRPRRRTWRHVATAVGRRRRHLDRPGRRAAPRRAARDVTGESGRLAERRLVELAAAVRRRRLSPRARRGPDVVAPAGRRRS